MRDKEREQRLEELYSAALKHDTSERDEFLRQACGGDADLRSGVESLLSYEHKLDGFLEGPPLLTGELGTISPEQSHAGRRLGPYNLLQRIGVGEVWMAEQKQPVRRRVALKS